MTQNARQILEGLILALLLPWIAPLSESVVVPAHAQTSQVGYDAPGGCYDLDSGGSIAWPGGAPKAYGQVTRFTSSGCSGEPISGPAALDDSEDQASLMLETFCGRFFMLHTHSSSGLRGGRFFVCNNLSYVMQ